ncbi:hypothetical protein AALP_AA3G273200 [Arabis alpina]|uniref:Glycoside hydrolase family 31 N-terminal domain-containing protein n=1 Tax=Arabis alpina TaxID=50452 RepID=A0A087HC11_ARAAL|nr:hypothetical protein AALP_AA3G273200 [Arabis alpina]
MTVSGDSSETIEMAPTNLIFEPILEHGVFRFDGSVEHRKAAFPSVSFKNKKDREVPIISKNVPAYTPTCACLGEQQVVTFEFSPGTSFYGTGEVGGQLERAGKRVFTWNTDAWGYGPETTSLYQSHPWVLVVLPTGEALGVLADTTRKCEIDLRKEGIVRIIGPKSYPIITFGPFSSPISVLESLSHAIGTVFMPPKRALGYHQCRFSYMSEERVAEIAQTFRDKKIPSDVIWMDIDYMDGFRCFTSDKKRFPDPTSLQQHLHNNGFKAVWMLDPGIKQEEGYSVYDSGNKNDVWVRRTDGKPFIGEVWPGPCVFPDYTNSKARSWWANLVKDFVSKGVDGIWNDMNEPAVFNTVTKTMPDNNIHSGDDELGGVQNHSYYHNVYGMLMARSTYEGMELADKNKRPFVLTRAGFIGSQRYAATWTGDNLSTWEHLHMSISMVLQLGLSGQPFSGPDIGGFGGNATPRLFGRWMGIGAMFPFSRGHSEVATDDHEPWSFGEECEEVCRAALKRRYQLLPHFYTLFYIAHTTGALVAAPIFFADPKDSRLRTVENAFLLGPLLIYASTFSNQGSHELHHILPKGIWLRFDFEDSHPDLPTMYLQGGSIISLAPPHLHVGEYSMSDELSLLVSLDDNGKAVGLLFEDDGDGYGYTKGRFLITHYIAEKYSSIVTVKVSKTEGDWQRPKRRVHVQLLLGGGAMLDAWGMDGEVIQIKLPSESEISELISTSIERFNLHMESTKLIPEKEVLDGQKEMELSRVPVELNNGDWKLNIIPWIGGRILSMTHVPSGVQWLHSRIDINGYEEYTGTMKSTEEYNITERDLEHAGEEESLILEGNVGGGLVLQRKIFIPKDNPHVFRIASSIEARSVGAGSGGFSRLVYLRVHPTFTLFHPTESFVSFASIDGSKHEVGPESREQLFEGNNLPDGEWMLVDKSLNLGLINRFDVSQVFKCIVHWDCGTVNLELWSEERPVSKESPLEIEHEYQVTSFP